VQLPFAAARVLAHVWSGTSKPIRMQAVGADGTHLGAVATAGASDPAAPDVLELQQAGISELLFIGGGGEGMLVDLCIDRGEYPDVNQKEPGRDDRPTRGAAVRRRATTGAAGCGCDE
jgi:hypothetical protein